MTGLKLYIETDNREVKMIKRRSKWWKEEQDKMKRQLENNIKEKRHAENIWKIKAHKKWKEMFMWWAALREIIEQQ